MMTIARLDFAFVSNIGGYQHPNLSSVSELVDLCSGNTRKNKTHRHDGEAGQNFIPHDERTAVRI